MPIIVNDFTWSQSDKALIIRIPVSRVHHEKVDVFTTDSYIKVNFSPFLFEVFLLHDINNSKSKTIISDDLITLNLVKQEELEWDSLEKDLSKAEKMELKKVIIEKEQERAQKEAEDRRVKKSQLDRFTVQQAMDIDTKQHNIMDTRRDDERKKAMEELEDWRIKTDNKELRASVPTLLKAKTSGVKIVELSTSEDEEEDTTEKVVSKKAEYSKPPPRQPVKVRSEYVEKKKNEMKKRVLPGLREAGELKISHTPRTFPTPSRESAASEEEAWLKNVTLARRATGFISEDLRPEEHDPQWCKEKGDEFFRNGNHLGAISAYTHGIMLSDKLPSLFANRSAVHFALGNFNKCLNDCSTALELMVPPCEGNRKSRAKCIARRAAALVRVGYLNKAIDEMKAAAKLLPDDEKIKQDIYDMERAWEQNPDSD